MDQTPKPTGRNRAENTVSPVMDARLTERNPLSGLIWTGFGWRRTSALNLRFPSACWDRARSGLTSGDPIVASNASPNTETFASILPLRGATGRPSVTAVLR